MPEIDYLVRINKVLSIAVIIAMLIFGGIVVGTTAAVLTSEGSREVTVYENDYIPELPNGVMIV